MTSEELVKKLNVMPRDTVLYIFYNGEFLPIDCIRLNREDEEAVILPIKDCSGTTKK